MELYAGFMGVGAFLTDVYLNLPNPTFLSCPDKSHIRVYNKNLQTSRVW